jgi:hypothetical protein
MCENAFTTAALQQFEVHHYVPCPVLIDQNWHTSKPAQAHSRSAGSKWTECKHVPPGMSQAWNAQRHLVLEEVLSRALLPALKAELRVRLVAEAREVVANRAGEALWKLASAPPLRVMA